MSLADRRRALLGQNGEKLYYEPQTGAFYPKHLDITVTPPNFNNIMTCRYAYCNELETAIIRGTAKIGDNAPGNNVFTYCPNLKSIILPDGCGSQGIIARGADRLEEVVLGSIGHPVSKVHANAFLNSGRYATSKTITIYVTDDTTLPLENEPWGYADANVIYRSATSGEVIEV